MIRISPQQKQSAFALYFDTKKRGELERFELTDGLCLAVGPEEIRLLALDEEIWVCHPTEGAVLVGEGMAGGKASIDVEVHPNWDHHTTPWWEAAHSARNTPSFFRQLSQSGFCQVTETEASSLESWASVLEGWKVERTALFSLKASH